MAWDKAEIVREAADIGTLAVSGLPAEDCCTLFASPFAETRAPAGRLATLEAKLGLEETIEELVAASEWVRPRLIGDPEASLVGQTPTEAVPNLGGLRLILPSSYIRNIQA